MHGPAPGFGAEPHLVMLRPSPRVLQILRKHIQRLRSNWRILWINGCDWAADMPPRLFGGSLLGEHLGSIPIRGSVRTIVPTGDEIDRS